MKRSASELGLSWSFNFCFFISTLSNPSRELKCTITMTTTTTTTSKNNCFYEQNNGSARVSPVLLYIFDVHCTTDYDVKPSRAPCYGVREHMTIIFFFLLVLKLDKVLKN